MIASLRAFRWAKWRLLCSLATSSFEMFCLAMAGPETGSVAPWALWGGCLSSGSLGSPRAHPTVGHTRGGL